MAPFISRGSSSIMRSVRFGGPGTQRSPTELAGCCRPTVMTRMIPSATQAGTMRLSSRSRIGRSVDVLEWMNRIGMLARRIG